MKMSTFFAIRFQVWRVRLALHPRLELNIQIFLPWAVDGVRGTFWSSHSALAIFFSIKREGERWREEGRRREGNRKGDKGKRRNIRDIRMHFLITSVTHFSSGYGLRLRRKIQMNAQ